MNNLKYMPTKKTLKLSFFVLIALLGLGILMNTTQTLKTTSSSQTKLNYLALRGSGPKDFPQISLSPENSDQVENQSVLNMLVATVVKYGVSGKIEPYLAESWSVSDDGLIWEFKIKSGYTCQKGKLISSTTIKESLLKSFSSNLKKTDKTDFNSLLEWQEFERGQSDLSKSIISKADSLVLIFKRPVSGLLNYLRMPYFGVWCEEKQNGKAPISGFLSSGPYKLKQVINPSRLLLEMRKDQPSFDANAPQIIEIGYGTLEEVQKSDTPTIAKYIVDDTPIEIRNYSNITGPPLILQSIVLNPQTEFFKDIRNRKIFEIRLNKFKAMESGRKFSSGFYLNSKMPDDHATEIKDAYFESSALKVAIQFSATTLEMREFWERLFKYTLAGLDYKITYPDLSNPGWAKEMIASNSFHIRTASVYPGASHSVSTIQMMFCSKLGISFPDPSKKICRLVDEYIEGRKQADSHFETTFNKVLVEDKVVFPLFHSRDAWLVSNSIDTQTMPTSIIHPLFEAIRFR